MTIDRGGGRIVLPGARRRGPREVDADILQRVRSLEATPNGGGGGGGTCDCSCIEAEHVRALPFNNLGWVGYGDEGFAGSIDQWVADSACIGGGYVEAATPLVMDTTHWVVYLGAHDAGFNFQIMYTGGPDCGELSLYAERLAKDGIGNYERQDPTAIPIDVFGGPFQDLYTAGTVRNALAVSYTFTIAGEGCDEPFEFVGGEGYGLSGSPGFYRLWFVVTGKRADSSGFAARLQSVWLRRNLGDEP